MNFAHPNLAHLSRRLLCCLFAFTLSACTAGLFGGSEPTPEVKNLLVGVTSRHLGLIVMGDATAVAASVFPDDYFGKGGLRVSAHDFEIQIAELKRKYPATPMAHPLLGLKVTDVAQSENDAVVVLAKDPKYLQSGQDNPKIRVKLIWTGAAWIVASDSLFGSGGLVPKLVNEKSAG